MAFDPERCYIPTVYCGKAEKKYPYVEHDNLYLEKGTPDQCLRKGFGAATAKENKKHLPPGSLQNIRYVGPTFDANFQKEGIRTVAELADLAHRTSPGDLERLLQRVFRNSNKTLNGRGFNSTLLYLYHSGHSKLPQCVNLRE